MAINIEEELETLYERWLMEYCHEEIHNKEDLIELSSDGKYRDEFNELVKKNL